MGYSIPPKEWYLHRTGVVVRKSNMHDNGFSRLKVELSNPEGIKSLVEARQRPRKQAAGSLRPVPTPHVSAIVLSRVDVTGKENT
jgi:hypothetical protein